MSSHLNSKGQVRKQQHLYGLKCVIECLWAVKARMRDLREIMIFKLQKRLKAYGKPRLHHRQVSTNIAWRGLPAWHHSCILPCSTSRLITRHLMIITACIDTVASTLLQPGVHYTALTSLQHLSNFLHCDMSCRTHV
jgi:hypothetical protein